MEYALIKNGKVANIIVVNDHDFVNLIKHQYDECIYIDNHEPYPMIGWTVEQVKASHPEAKEIFEAPVVIKPWYKKILFWK